MPRLPLLAVLVLLLAASAEAARPELEQYALTRAGDVDRGREIYASKAMQCVVCHKNGDVDAAGAAIGPELTAIGNKFDRPHIVDSLLNPSREIGYGYQTRIIRLDDGRQLAGLVKERTDDRLTLVDAKGDRHEIAVAEIEAERASEVSLMPAGLFDQIAADDFVDLVAYLESLRPGAKGDWGSGTTGPIGVPDGWSLSIVASGLDGLTALETLPDGRVLVCEQTGRVRMIENDTLLPEPVVSLPVDSLWERGVIGVTVAPNFPRDPHLYVAWVAKEPYSHHRISRFVMDGDVALPETEQVIFRGDDQSQYEAQVIAGHQGGGLHFGPDGMLYLGIGEHTAGQPAQRLDAFLGKIIRIAPDGSIPDDNPLLDRTEGKYGAIWAYGCRNPFTFAFRNDGLMLINDVGGKFEEINPGIAGANFGWPGTEHGPTDRDGITEPIHWYPQSSVNGGDFAPDSLGDDAGRYYFADYIQGFIRSLDPDDPREARDFATGMRRPVDLRFAGDGSLYVLLRNSWVIDDKFAHHAGSVVKFSPPSATEAPIGVRLDADAASERTGMPVMRVATPSATYELEPSGGGLSSLIDAEGNDWISFNPMPGTRASGEFRGWPNAVYQPPRPGYFHPRNEGTGPCKCRVATDSPQLVSIVCEAGDGWAGRFDFFADHAAFTVTAIPDGGRYWCLYEGTPGGSLDADDWWVSSNRSERQAIGVSDDSDLDGREWIAFGDTESDVAVLLTATTDDDHPDAFYQMDDAMTVFGFGRRGIERYLTKPHRFTIGLVPAGTADEFAAAAAQRDRPAGHITRSRRR